MERFSISKGEVVECCQGSRMATSLKSSFVGSMGLSRSMPTLVEPRISSRFRVVSQGGHSTAIRGSEGNVAKPEREVSRFIDTGIEKQRELWWAPLFNVSAEEQWSKLLTKQTKEPEQHGISSGSPDVAPPRTTAAVALPDLIDSTTSSERRRPNYSKVAFTPEKARALRKSMRASETWHDDWYHSAIATRLAEPVD